MTVAAQMSSITTPAATDGGDRSKASATESAWIKMSTCSTARHHDPNRHLATWFCAGTVWKMGTGVLPLSLQTGILGRETTEDFARR